MPVYCSFCLICLLPWWAESLRDSSQTTVEREWGIKYISDYLCIIHMNIADGYGVVDNSHFDVLEKAEKGTGGTSICNIIDGV